MPSSIGGVSQVRQEGALRARLDILVATPGRLLDLMRQGLVRLDRVQHYVLDEADRMLDMGFVHDVRRISAALPAKRQTLFFSATVPPDDREARRSMLSDPVARRDHAARDHRRARRAVGLSSWPRRDKRACSSAC